MNEEERKALAAEKQRKRYADKAEVRASEHKRRRTPEQRYAKARYDAAHRDSGEKEFKLSLEEYKIIIAGRCTYCNCDISQEGGSGLDRIDNDNGYSVDNVNACCAACNRRRSKSMSAEEFKLQSRYNGYWVD